MPARTIINKAARYFGFNITRYPSSLADSTNLINQWVRSIQSTGQVQVIFDVGANHGQTITRFRWEFPESTIYAFEPCPSTFIDLQDRTKKDLKVKLFNLALGAYDGYAVLYENANDVTNSLLSNSGQISKYAPSEMCAPKGISNVPIMRLDSFCRKESIKQIDILKIDAQGYERHILSGADNILVPSLVRGLFLEVLFVELYDNQSWCGEIIEILRSRGYRLFGFTDINYDDIHGWKWADAMFIGD